MKDPKRLETLKALVRRVTEEFADEPNVLGVGWGMARRGGELRPELSLVFFVRKKLGVEELEASGARVVPLKIEDFPTDVVVRGPVSRTQMAGRRDDDLFDPLVGGVASANLEQMDRTFFWSEGSVGTLGILCRDGGGREMALSNWHVWADDGAQNGDRIVQPGTPDGGGYAEGIAKAVMCGPFISTLLEGRLPSGLATGLYAGAAAAAAAAALSDDKDPFRRGQDATPEAGDAITHLESLAVRMRYDDTPPWPGKAFSTRVKWAYTRHTNQGLMKTEADERKENQQVLRGYAVAPDRAVYEAGDTIVVSASLWDHQFRPDDAYHVVANLVSAADPDRYLRLVLHPVECRGIHLVPSARQEHNAPRAVRLGEGGNVCLDFRFYAVDQVFERAYNFGPIAAAYYDGDGPLRMARILDISDAGLYVPAHGVVFRHAPASSVVVRLAHAAGEPVRISAYDALDRKLAETIAPADPNVVHELVLQRDMITHVRVTGGLGRLQVFEYCFHPVAASTQPSASGGAPVAPTAPAATRTGELPASRSFARVAVQPSIGLGRLHCEGFEKYAAGTTFPAVHQFGEIRIAALDKNRQRIVDWPSTEPNSLLFSSDGIAVSHGPSDRVVLRVGHFTGEDVLIRAFDASGNLQQEVVKTSANSVEVIQLAGNGIVRVNITGGGHEGILVRYCFDRGDGDGGDDRSYLRCFRGAMPLPPDAPSGRWIVYLAVQNLNHVPDGVPPEQAATIIGGHVMGPTANVLGCGFMLLGDHVFDIF